jgi:hypothetical protein
MMVFFSFLIGIFGYEFLIVPAKNNQIFFLEMHEKYRFLLLKKKKPLTDFSLSLNAQKEVSRWLSESGGLVNWSQKKINGREVFDFTWLGTYEVMLRIMTDWPSNSRIQRMRWQFWKVGGVQWSGQYAMVS